MASEHCYMYFLNRKRGIDTSRVYHTESFFLHKNIINLDYASIPYTLHSPLVQPIELYMYVLSNP